MSTSWHVSLSPPTRVSKGGVCVGVNMQFTDMSEAARMKFSQIFQNASENISTS